MRRALGKGLAQLLGESQEQSVDRIPIDSIVASSVQPRKVFDAAALNELADSIVEHGILQPLLVRPSAEGTYELIAGERRFRAAKKAGLKEVPVVVKAAGTQMSLELALIENVQREDISAIESALAYKMLSDDFDMSQEQIAKRVSKSRAAVANTLRLLQLPSEIQDAIVEGRLSEGHARALLTAPNPEIQKEVFQAVLDEGLSVRQTEQLCRSPIPKKDPVPTTRTKRDPHVEALRKKLSERLGTRVQISGDIEKGRIVLPYDSMDDLERMLDILGVTE